jgi:hypothetical protein
MAASGRTSRTASLRCGMWPSAIWSRWPRMAVRGAVEVVERGHPVLHASHGCENVTPSRFLTCRQG